MDNTNNRPTKRRQPRQGPREARRADDAAIAPQGADPDRTAGTDVAPAEPRIGRPSELTPEKRKKILDATRVGASRSGACLYAGIAESTFYRWIERGRTARRSEYSEFWEEVRAADAQAEITLITLITVAAKKGDWRAAAFLLERRFPKRWARREHVTHAGDRTAPVVFTLDIPKPPGVQRQLPAGDDSDRGGEE